MKNIKAFVVLVTSFVFFVNIATSQVKMKPEEADAKIKDLTAKVNDLKNKNTQATKEIEDLNVKKVQLQTDVAKCNDDVLALVGATKSMVDEYNQKLESVEKKIDGLSRLSNKDLFDRKGEIDDCQKGADDLKKSKISLLPQFYDRVQALQGKIDNLRNALKVVNVEKIYTVGTWAKDKDCLWNISKKTDIYDNPLLWPKIWQGNKEKIKDPDIIKTGMELKIPPKAELSEDETKAARKYWMNKKEQVKQKEGETQKEPKQKIKEQKIEK